MKTKDTILQVLATMVSALIIVLGAHTLITEPVTLWGGTSMTVALILLTVTTVIAWYYHASFFSWAAFLYSSVLVGRLFGTLRLVDTGSDAGVALDPLLVGETGPGIPSMTYLSYILVGLVSILLLRFAYQWSHDQNTDGAHVASATNDWALTFIRMYVGLMFIAHYSGHVLAGPLQFQIFSEYFSGVGLGIGGPLVILAGVIEIAVSIGLVFGLMTRIAAVGGALYLFFATLWGAHFSAGYVWILPNGGWEFTALWGAVILAFAVTGGSRISVDELMQRIAPRPLGWYFR